MYKSATSLPTLLLCAIDCCGNYLPNDTNECRATNEVLYAITRVRNNATPRIDDNENGEHVHTGVNSLPKRRVFPRKVEIIKACSDPEARYTGK